LLGFEAKIPVREGLERYVEWLRAREGAIELARSESVRNW
jgi:hypothetical protein